MGRGECLGWLLLMLGCEAEQMVYARSEPITAADGRPAMLITCVESVGRCYIRASRVCPQGYTTLDSQGLVGSESESRGYATGGSGWGRSHGTTTTSATYRGTMLIQCGTAAPAPSPSAITPPRPVVSAPAPTPTGSATIDHDTPF